jgi:hypothetical protein
MILPLAFNYFSKSDTERRFPHVPEQRKRNMPTATGSDPNSQLFPATFVRCNSKTICPAKSVGTDKFWNVDRITLCVSSYAIRKSRKTG